jgi:hypothetical protein
MSPLVAASCIRGYEGAGRVKNQSEKTPKIPQVALPMKLPSRHCWRVVSSAHVCLPPSSSCVGSPSQCRRATRLAATRRAAALAACRKTAREPARVWSVAGARVVCRQVHGGRRRCGLRRSAAVNRCTGEGCTVGRPWACERRL